MERRNLSREVRLYLKPKTTLQIRSSFSRQLRSLCPGAPVDQRVHGSPMDPDEFGGITGLRFGSELLAAAPKAILSTPGWL